MEQVYWVLDKQFYKYTRAICNKVLIWLHERGSIIHYTFMACVLLFSSIMNEIWPQCLHASSFCTCIKVHICTGCSVYLCSWMEPTAKFVLYIEVHDCFSQVSEKVFKLLCSENFKISLISVYSNSTYSTQQYLHYCTLVVFCSILLLFLRRAIQLFETFLIPPAFKRTMHSLT